MPCRSISSGLTPVPYPGSTGDQCVEARSGIENQRAAGTALTEGQLAARQAAARHLQRPVVQGEVRRDAAGLHDLAPAEQDILADRGSAARHDLDGAAEDPSRALRSAVI